jgi:hypothetical protein
MPTNDLCAATEGSRDGIEDVEDPAVPADSDEDLAWRTGRTFQTVAKRRRGLLRKPGSRGRGIAAEGG